MVSSLAYTGMGGAEITYARTSSRPAIWSLCGWVNTRHRTFLRWARNIWYRKSGVVSTTIEPWWPIRRGCWNAGVCPAYRARCNPCSVQPIMGTPLLVPVPKKSNFQGRRVHHANVKRRSQTPYLFLAGAVVQYTGHGIVKYFFAFGA